MTKTPTETPIHQFLHALDAVATRLIGSPERIARDARRRGDVEGWPGSEPYRIGGLEQRCRSAGAEIRVLARRLRRLADPTEDTTSASLQSLRTHGPDAAHLLVEGHAHVEALRRCGAPDPLSESAPRESLAEIARVVHFMDWLRQHREAFRALDWLRRHAAAILAAWEDVLGDAEGWRSALGTAEVTIARLTQDRALLRAEIRGLGAGPKPADTGGADAPLASARRRPAPPAPDARGDGASSGDAWRAVVEEVQRAHAAVRIEATPDQIRVVSVEGPSLSIPWRGRPASATELLRIIALLQAVDGIERANEGVWIDTEGVPGQIRVLASVDEDGPVLSAVFEDRLPSATELRIAAETLRQLRARLVTLATSPREASS